GFASQILRLFGKWAESPQLQKRKLRYLLATDCLSVSASTPGSFMPDKNSSDAPPPVEICVILDATPACVTAATESPPPTIDVARDVATARAISSVPWANCGISKTPMGPFQTIVFERAISRANSARVAGPMST